MTRTQRFVRHSEAFKTVVVSIICFICTAPVFEWLFQTTTALVRDRFPSSGIVATTSVVAIAIAFATFLALKYLDKKKVLSIWWYPAIVPLLFLTLGLMLNGFLGVFVAMTLMVIESWPK